ncbi:outer membrane beta-barrel protein [Kordia sp. TARA_039_SRF]|nr:outer membrane beta-barrel protein [Kordia sp. TARA_039_SRF]
MKKSMLILYFLLFAATTMAQNIAFEIKGAVSGVMDSIPLESATIYLQNNKDNSLIKYTTSNRKGEFTLSGNTAYKEATLFVSYVGSKTFSKKISLQSKISLKPIYLENSSMLDAVMIESTLPVTIKQDTLEFDPKSFKTKRNASVEDFIKKLPGVQVDFDGNITVNGVRVNKILVNGRPFFPNDPTMATQNLTKEIIEKLQITDSKSNSEIFTGEMASGDAKTINLVIKEENNKGAFGKLSAGMGDTGRYELAGNYNRFNNQRNLSFMGTGNNINAPNVGFGTKGIRTSQKMGVSYNEDLGKFSSLSVNYMYADAELENRKTQFTEYIVPEAPYFSNLSNRSITENRSHNIDLEYQTLLGETFHLNLQSSFASLPSESNYNSNAETFDEFDELINTSTVNSTDKVAQKEFRNTLHLTKKIGEQGAFVKLTLNQNLRNLDSDAFVASELLFLNSNSDDILRNQFTDTDDMNLSFDTGITFRVPIFKKKIFVDVNYNYFSQKDESDKAVFDFNSNQQTFSDFNNMLSSDFTNRNIASVPSVKFNYRNKKINAFFNLDYTFRTLENEDQLRPELNIKRSFDIFTYSGGFRYRVNRRSVFNAGVQLSNMIPSLSQLQTFTDVTDPLNIVRGNPNLQPQNRYAFHVDYRTNNFKKGYGLFGKLKMTLDNNRVVSRYTINDDLVRETTFVNIDGNYNYYGYVDVYKQLKLSESSAMRIRLNGSVNHSKRINFNNDIRYDVKTTMYTPSLGVDFEWQQYFDINADYNLNFSQTRYSLDGFNDEEITMHELNLFSEIQIFERLYWENRVRYLYNPNVSGDFDNYAWSWNSGVSYSFWDDTASVSLRMYDVLDQNINTRRIVTTDFIQNTQSLVLQRFFMLTFDWRFNSLKKKLPKPK